MTAVQSLPVARRRTSRPRVARVARPVVAVAVLIGAQEALTRTDVLPAGYFPPASEIVRTFVGELGDDSLGPALMSTVRTWLLALLVSVGLGTAVGVLLGLVRPLEAFLRPVIEFMRPVPSVALIPLVVLTIGTGSGAALFLACFAAFWQVLVPVITGVRSAPAIALDTARSYSLSTWQRIRWIQLPSMLPHLATATRLAASTTLILIVTAEIIIQMPGIGHEITMSRSAGDPARMYAYIALSGAAGIVLNVLVRRIEKRLNASHGLEGSR
ncbi:ABC transporter permease subunit [Aeromicrobium phragmitis]|uniref:ABC transporter permease subunit n=1 Tax=Aeromicrobium phragmitis TaxID=2478914 RepID=A0A3L8PNN3_9ACTN|nr:ABC transporter permease subunit [Aeromicrobium phragmitis]RLV57005.1 ABC transporter permease subunit [Aeromicrobium phragmitis]